MAWYYKGLIRIRKHNDLWVYKTKFDSKGINEKYKARLMSKSFTQRKALLVMIPLHMCLVETLMWHNMIYNYVRWILNGNLYYGEILDTDERFCCGKAGDIFSLLEKPLWVETSICTTEFEIWWTNKEIWF